MSWEEYYGAHRVDATEAIVQIPKGKHIFIGSGAAEPVALVAELVAQASHFADNAVVHLLTLGPAPYVDPALRTRFRHNAFFIGPNVRSAVHEGRADYTPVFLSQIPALIRSRRMPIDVALVQVSPPDRFGFVNLGVSVDIVLAAIECAALVIAEVNPRMPVVYGAGFVPVHRFHAFVEAEHDLPTLPREPLDDVAREIGKNVASLIDDGSTLQLGIGQVPDAVAAALSSHGDLGVWTEMFSDGVVDLIENGNVNGRRKTIERDRVTASFAFGSERLYERIDRNPVFSFHPSDYTNDPLRIARQNKMVAINSALQLDVTGQVCADSLGDKFYSGIGGQVDFIRGASMSPGGKPIIAIRSTAKDGQISRIVPVLDEGAGVVTSRGDVHYVVTEYGVADLQGRSIRERAQALISVAHPDFRGEILEAAKRRHYVFPDQITGQAQYPARYETHLSTPKGPLLLRPIRITDEQKMSDLFYALSREAVYRRWMNVMPRMPHERLLYYLDVDYVARMAMVVETIVENEESEIVAVGRYHVDPKNNFAEVAFVVRDDWQGAGLGTALLRQLIHIARQNGIAGFTAEVLAENDGMLHVFQKSGLTMETTLEAGVCSVRMPFPKPSADGAP